MKITLELHSGGEALTEIVAAHLGQANPSATLKRILLGVQAATVPAGDEAHHAELCADLEALAAKWDALERADRTAGHSPPPLRGGTSRHFSAPLDHRHRRAEEGMIVDDAKRYIVQLDRLNRLLIVGYVGFPNVTWIHQKLLRTGPRRGEWATMATASVARTLIGPLSCALANP